MTRPLKQNGISAEVLANLEACRLRALAACSRKARYSDEHAARAGGCYEIAIGKAERLYVYQCKVCRGWHLTRQVQPPYYAADYYEQGK